MCSASRSRLLVGSCSHVSADGTLGGRPRAALPARSPPWTWTYSTAAGLLWSKTKEWRRCPHPRSVPVPAPARRARSVPPARHGTAALRAWTPSAAWPARHQSRAPALAVLSERGGARLHGAPGRAQRRGHRVVATEGAWPCPCGGGGLGRRGAIVASCTGPRSEDHECWHHALCLYVLLNCNLGSPQPNQKIQRRLRDSPLA